MNENGGGISLLWWVEWDVVKLQCLKSQCLYLCATSYPQLHTIKDLPDSRSSHGWLYLKDALLKKNVHMLLLTLVF